MLLAVFGSHHVESKLNWFDGTCVVDIWRPMFVCGYGFAANRWAGSIKTLILGSRLIVCWWVPVVLLGCSRKDTLSNENETYKLTFVVAAQINQNGDCCVIPCLSTIGSGSTSMDKPGTIKYKLFFVFPCVWSRGRNFGGELYEVLITD